MYCTATKKNVLDDFLSDKRRSRIPTITLYDWAKICNCPKTKSCGTDHVPMFTGCSNYYTWPIDENFARAQLMMFSEGTWKRTDDLLSVSGTVYDNNTSAFAAFLDMEQCPEALKLMLRLAKEQYDAKLDKKCKTIQDFDMFSQNSSQSQSSTSFQRNTLGYQLMCDIAKEQRILLMDAGIDDEILPDGGPTFNWYKYATDSLQGCITLSEDNITTAKNWLAYIAVQAENDAITYASGCDLPKVKPLLVNHKQMLIVYYNLKELLQIAKGCAEITSVRKRLLVQGIAGTGKPQVIQIITGLCRRIFKSNRAVLNVVPTSAAAVLLPDGRTVHSVTPPPMKKTRNCTMSQLLITL